MIELLYTQSINQLKETIMDLTLILTAGVAMFFNLAIIYWKGYHEQYVHAFIDAGLFAVIIYVTGGTGQGGMIAGMIASALLSLLLLIMPLPIASESEVA